NASDGVGGVCQDPLAEVLVALDGDVGVRRVARAAAGGVAEPQQGRDRDGGGRVVEVLHDGGAAIDPYVDGALGGARELQAHRLPLGGARLLADDEADGTGVLVEADLDGVAA